MRAYRYVSWLTVLAMGNALAEPGCDFSQPVPQSWKAVNASVVTLSVPADFRLRALDTTDTWAHEISNKNVTFTVDYGMPTVEEKATTERRVQLDGGTVLFESGADTITLWWPNVGPQRQLGVEARFSREADRQLACRVLGSLRLLGSVEELKLLRIRAEKGKFSARIEVRGRYRRIFVVGDVATLGFGKIRAIDADSVVVAEVLPNEKGGWKEQITRLTLPGK